MTHDEFIINLCDSLSKFINYANGLDHDKVDLAYESASKIIFSSPLQLKVQMVISELHPSYIWDYVDPKTTEKENLKNFFYALVRYINNRDRLSIQQEIEDKTSSIFLNISEVL